MFSVITRPCSHFPTWIAPPIGHGSRQIATQTKDGIAYVNKFPGSNRPVLDWGEFLRIGIPWDPSLFFLHHLGEYFFYFFEAS